MSTPKCDASNSTMFVTRPASLHKLERLAYVNIRVRVISVGFLWLYISKGTQKGLYLVMSHTQGSQ